MAIAGVPATAWEMARVLEHSFQFYRRSQLQEMSLDGKVRALSKLLRDNFGFVMQGVGIVVPIFATYDTRRAGRRGSTFTTPWAPNLRRPTTPPAAPARRRCAASCTMRIPGATKPLAKRNEAEMPCILALRALDTAAETDTATGGVDRRGRVYPIVKIVSAAGIATLPEKHWHGFQQSTCG